MGFHEICLAYALIFGLAGVVSGMAGFAMKKKMSLLALGLCYVVGFLCLPLQNGRLADLVGPFVPTGVVGDLIIVLSALAWIILWSVGTYQILVRVFPVKETA